MQEVGIGVPPCLLGYKSMGLKLEMERGQCEVDTHTAVCEEERKSVFMLN